MTVIATSNLDYGRRWLAHRRDVRRILKRADVVAVQELRRRLGNALNRVARTVQPSRRGGAPGSEAIFVARRSDVVILERGSVAASHRKYGQAIGDRRLVWVRAQLPDVRRPVTVIDYHRVPLRMQDSLIDEAQDARCRALVDAALKRHDHAVVLGDMNQLVRADPAGLVENFGGTWHGVRIDLAWLSAGLRAAQVDHEQDPHRGDHHPVVYIDVKEKQ